MTFPELKAFADDTAAAVRLAGDGRIAAIVQLDALFRVYARAKLEVLDEIDRLNAEAREQLITLGGPHVTT